MFIPPTQNFFFLALLENDFFFFFFLPHFHQKITIFPLRSNVKKKKKKKKKYAIFLPTYPTKQYRVLKVGNI